MGTETGLHGLCTFSSPHADGGLSDFNNPSLFLTFPPSDSEMTMSVPLGSTIIPDAINEAQEGLVMVLDVDVMSLDPEDATNLVPSSRGVALLFISDDDGEINKPYKVSRGGPVSLIHGSHDVLHLTWSILGSVWLVWRYCICTARKKSS